MVGLDEYGPEQIRQPERKNVLDLLRASGLTESDENFLAQNPVIIKTLVRLIQEAQSAGDRFTGQNKLSTRKRLDKISPRQIYDATRECVRRGIKPSPTNVAIVLSGGILDPALAGRLLGSGRAHAIINAQIRGYHSAMHNLPWEETLEKEWQQAGLRQDEQSKHITSVKEPTAPRRRVTKEVKVNREIVRRFGLFAARLEQARSALRVTSEKEWAVEVRSEIDTLSESISTCSDKIHEAQEALESLVPNTPFPKDLIRKMWEIETELSSIERQYKRLVEDE